MSRTRIVGGKIIKTTGGNHKMFSQGTIRENAASIKEVALDGSIFGTPQAAPPAPTIAKCVVEFRPNKNWKGEFGFDWCRKADSKMPVDIPYKGIIGKYGDIYATEPGAVFTPDNNLYLTHLQEYSSFNCCTGKYYVPNVTLMDGETAVFDTITEVVEEPEKLHYVYDTDIFELTILKKVTTTKGKHIDENALKIKCLKQFSTKQSIRIIATKDKYLEKVGEVFVLPNNGIKNVDVVFIPVAHNGVTGSLVGNEKQILLNGLRQAYVKANITQYPKPITVGNWWFDLFFTTKDKNGNTIMDTSSLRSIHQNLDDVFFKDPNNQIYKNYYRLYMLSTGTLNGAAENIGNTKTVVGFDGRNESTAPHELMHAMGLYHTFDNSGLFTYELHNTDNIMDYTHQIGKKRFSTNKWQWKIINPNIK